MPTATATAERPTKAELKQAAEQKRRDEIRAYMATLTAPPSPSEVRKRFLQDLCTDAIAAAKKDDAKLTLETATTLCLEFAKGFVPGAIVPVLHQVGTLADTLLACLVPAITFGTKPQIQPTQRQLGHISDAIASIESTLLALRTRTPVLESVTELVIQNVSTEQICNMTGVSMVEIEKEKEAIRWARLTAERDSISFERVFQSTFPPGFIAPKFQEQLKLSEAAAVETFDLVGRERLCAVAYHLSQLRAAGLV